MKALFLLRHARAENVVAGSSDHARVLNERGQEESRAIGGLIKEQALKFDLVLCSPAARARETAELVIAAAGLTSSLREDKRIYEAPPFRLLEVISEIEVNANAALLIGHNPGIEELLKLLTGRAEHVSTATLARINLTADEWRKVADAAASLAWIVTPSELAGL